MRVLSMKETIEASGGVLTFNTQTGSWVSDGPMTMHLHDDGSYEVSTEDGWFLSADSDGSWVAFAPDGNEAGAYA